MPDTQEPAIPRCDLIFVFGGSHPQLWKSAYELYQQHGGRILVTGGFKAGTIRHPDWTLANAAEADVMASKLMTMGVPNTDIVVENRSTNTLENVRMATELFDFASVGDVAMVCKSFAAGRQWRTLKKHLPAHVRLHACTFDITLPTNGAVVSKKQWFQHPEGRSLVYGEYLRIVQYSRLEHIWPLQSITEGLEEHVETVLQEVDPS